MSAERKVSSYQRLNVWQRAIDLAERIYRLTASFPKHELYGLVSQMQRAAVSIPSNIAEGHARDSTKEYLRHLSIAFGSLAELETQLHLAARLNYCNAQQVKEVFDIAAEVGRMMRGLQRALRAKL